MHFNKKGNNMSLIKKVAPMIVLSGLLATGNVVAAEPTQGTVVSFEALIRAASCNVSSSTEGSRVDWGTFTTEEARSVGVNNKLGADKTFNLELSNCSKVLAEDGVISLYARGNKSNLNSDYFANATANTLAVKLTAKDNDGDQDIKPNLETALKLGKEIAVDGTGRIPMTAALYLTSADIDTDELKVPVTFTVSYN